MPISPDFLDLLIRELVSAIAQGLVSTRSVQARSLYADGLVVAHAWQDRLGAGEPAERVAVDILCAAEAMRDVHWGRAERAALRRIRRAIHRHMAGAAPPGARETSPSD